jgi:glycosyltransferase involved in cell wall biosynthesis
MPSYNSEAYIQESIESVLNQTYRNWELLITDDGSTDKTAEIVKKISRSDSRIKFYIQQENGGAGKARNNSISKVKGRFIAFLDSDDSWHKEKLSKQINFMLESNVAFSYTYYQNVVQGELSKIITSPESVSYEQLLKSNVIGCLTAVYDKEVLGINYMPKIRKRQDMGLWLELLKKTNKAYCLPCVLAYYRADSGMTQNKVEILYWQWKFYREVLGISVVQAIYYFLFYTVNAIKKHKL